MKFTLSRIRGKKKEKRDATFEDAFKAKVKLDLYEDRKKIIKNIHDRVVMGKDGKPKLGQNGKPILTDSPTLAMLKAQFLGSQAFGEIGDRVKITPKASMAFHKMVAMYRLKQQKYGEENCRALECMVLTGWFNMLNRSVRKEHTDVQIATPPPMFGSGYGFRSERISTLEK